MNAPTALVEGLRFFVVFCFDFLVSTSYDCYAPPHFKINLSERLKKATAIRANERNVLEATKVHIAFLVYHKCTYVCI